MIREYRATDLEDVLTVWEAASAVAHPFLDREFLERERGEIANVHLRRAETWVWEADGRVHGFVALLGNKVGAIFVDPRFHGSGIGRALMDHARALRGELEVEVFEANAIGRAFYAKYGFELVERKVHEPTGCGILRLRLVAEKPRPAILAPAVERLATERRAAPAKLDLLTLGRPAAEPVRQPVSQALEEQRAED